jgi:3,4-dihydroxy 2-butanone 4-phosphate synthase/GTP cyclohydrolase II
MKINKIEEIIEDLAQGKMVIIMDDEDREYEGDLIMVASKVSPEDINFMVTNGRGLVCMPITQERCEQLKLPLMVSKNDEKYSTNFTVSIEASEGVTTGISAYDRALTVRAAVAPDATEQDIVQPGHIFPLMAQPGGVLTRAGHTEAGCDLARLAGFEPAAVIVEILNEDGSMARRDDLEKFAEEHQLKMGTIEDLIRYRVENEKTVSRIQETQVKTRFGEFNLVAFREKTHKEIHLALVKGEISPEKPTLVRVHIENELCDMLSLEEGSCGWPLRDTMRRISDAGHGVIVILRDLVSTEDLLARLSQLEPHEPEQNEDKILSGELKTFGVGAQILSDLGVKKMRVMSAPKRFHGLAGFGLEIIDYVQG